MSLRDFLVEAKSQGYAAGRTAKTMPDDSKQLRHVGKDKKYLYVDSWRSSEDGRIFAGNENVVDSKGKEWAMNYMGYLLVDLSNEDMEKVYGFLREALGNIPREIPFRGPEIFTRENMTYSNKVKGDISKFTGVESIFVDGREVYQLEYSGGY